MMIVVFELVDDETLLSRDEVRSYDRENTTDTRANFMLSFQPLQPLRTRPGKYLVRLRRVDGNCIPADVWALEHVQEDESRWRRVRTTFCMPGHGSGTPGVAVAKSGVATAVVRDYQGQLWTDAMLEDSLVEDLYLSMDFGAMVQDMLKV
ncbi:hypothetical protein HO133_008244 [Letharia lupina]|uniref:Uncharacterized protein n=1 Tax=Letharia lupina TaxID=560253 RepID=A0A8H6FHW7_9LECA|nr:uncharacterized protein HO133_008244 [Letharia lupina]KAF6228514.1 hypothetical protein HO133_008244 [Letharia lupina]